MKTLSLIYQTLIRWLIQVWRLPQTMATAIKRRRQRTVFENNEIERLDRIRNPSKYLGK
jgi:hypothetical protein